MDLLLSLLACRPLLPEDASPYTYGVELELCYPCTVETVQEAFDKEMAAAGQHGAFHGWRCG